MRLLRLARDTHEQDWGELASAWLDGELSPEERAAFERHSRDCFRCQTRLQGFRSLSGQVKRNLNRLAPAPTVSATLLDPAARRRAQRHLVGARPRLALAGSAALLLVAGLATPQVRGAISGAARYAGCVAGAGCPASATGGVYFREAAGGVVVTAAQRFSLYTGSPGAGLTAASDALLPAGPIYGLANGRILYRTDASGQPLWVTATREGNDVRPFPLAGDMAVVDVTPDGSRLLVRRPLANGSGFDPDPAQTMVLDQDGSIHWRGNSSDLSADPVALTEDGSYVLGTTASEVKRISVAGGEPVTTLPVTARAPATPQVSADERRMALLESDSNEPNAPRFVAYVDLTPSYQQPYSVPVPAGITPVFRLSPDGRWLAVTACPDGADPATCAASGQAGLYLWNLDARRAVGEMPELRGTMITSLAWTPDSSALLITDTRDGAGEAWVHPVADPESLALTRVSAPGQVAAAAWLAYGGLAVAADGGRASGVVALDRGLAEHALPGAATPDYAPDGAAVALLQSGAAPLVETRSGARPAQLGRTVQAFAWAPGAQRAAAVIDGAVYLWSDRSGLASAPFAHGDAVAWSSNGQRILVTGAAGALLYDASGKAAGAPPADLAPATLQWAPVGQTLAGVRHGADGDELVVWQLETDRKSVVGRAPVIGSLAWSPDGNRLAYAAGASAQGAAQLRVVSAAGNGDAGIATLSAPSEPLLWQGDGSHILFLDRQSPQVPGRPIAVSPDGRSREELDLAATALLPGPRR